MPVVVALVDSKGRNPISQGEKQEVIGKADSDAALGQSPSNQPRICVRDDVPFHDDGGVQFMQVLDFLFWNRTEYEEADLPTSLANSSDKPSQLRTDLVPGDEDPLVRGIPGEERLLAKELEGYAEYRHRVRYRLLPPLW